MEVASATVGTCSICGSVRARILIARERMFGLGGAFPYGICATCGCVELLNAPLDLDRYYPAQSYYSFVPPAHASSGGMRSVLERIRLSLYGRALVIPPMRRALRQFLGSWRGRMTSFIDGHPHPWRAMEILDVGCGNGAHLAQFAQMGFTRLTGVDPFLNPHHPQPAGVKLCKCDISALPSNTYDLIWLTHSLEHMPRQIDALRQVCRLLRPGGIARVDVPVADGRGFAEYQDRWAELDAPRHFALHTAQSMAIAAQKAGLRVIRSTCYSLAFEFWGSELYRRDVSLYDSQGKANCDRFFSPRQMRDFEQQSREATLHKTGGRRIFWLEQHS